MQPLPEYEAQTEDGKDDAVSAALAWHDGDARATIATLLADCAHLRRQLDMSRSAMSRGFVRGWEPVQQRD